MTLVAGMTNGGLCGNDDGGAGLSVLTVWPGSTELPAVFLLDGLQAGFTNFAVVFGHVGFGDFSATITDHGSPCSWPGGTPWSAGVSCRSLFVSMANAISRDTTPTLMALSATLNAGQ